MKCMVKCLGIESTAHTFGCSVIDFPSNADAVANILSDSRDLYAGTFRNRDSSQRGFETSWRGSIICSQNIFRKRGVLQSKT